VEVAAHLFRVAEEVAEHWFPAAGRLFLVEEVAERWFRAVGHSFPAAAAAEYWFRVPGSLLTAAGRLFRASAHRAQDAV
jgi:hypothetical protein